MTGMREARFSGDVGNRGFGIGHKHDRARQPTLEQVLVRRDTGCLTERPCEVKGAHAGLGGQVVQRERLLQLSLDFFAHAPETA